LTSARRDPRDDREVLDRLTANDPTGAELLDLCKRVLRRKVGPDGIAARVARIEAKSPEDAGLFGQCPGSLKPGAEP
jgi:hypothetical protein